jgi:hypothetical protein
MLDDDPDAHAEHTGAPVSRTRRSLISLPERLRRRHLAGFAVGGVVLGTVVTLLLLSGGKEQKTPVVAAPSVATAEPRVEPKVVEEPKVEVAPVPSASASATPAPAVASSAPKKRKPLPAPRRSGIPDYGI